MEPMASNTELMLRFYQDMFQFIGWVFSIVALGFACVDPLFVCTEWYSVSHRTVRMSPRTAPL